MFNTLVISGGGLKGLASLGALHYYDSFGMLDNIDTYSGTSIGAVLCVLLASGYKPGDIFNDIYEMETFIDEKTSGLSVVNILNTFIPHKGLLDINSVFGIVEKMLKNRFGEIPSIKEFEHITFKKIYITTVNISQMKEEIFSSETYPDINIFTALKASCNIPLLFKELIIGGNYYIDGGLTHNIPLDIVLPRNKSNDISFDLTCILCICTRGIPKHTVDELTFIEYIYRTAMISINNVSKYTVQSAPECVTIVDINIENAPLLTHTLRKDEKFKIFINGYQMAEYEHNKIEIKEKI